MDLKDKLKAQVQSTPKAEPKSNITVKPGKQPLTYYTNDGMNEHLTTVDGNQKSCNCGPMGRMGGCSHVEAVELSLKATS
jgi:hypothetical protein